jgi:hypothetical protein
MKKYSLLYNCVISIGILFISLVLITTTFAWTNPSSNPPSGSGTLTASDSKIGIGTTDPGGVSDNAKLDVRGRISVIETASVELQIGTADYAWMEAFDGTNRNSKKYLNLNPWGGNVGIGTIAPVSRLDVAGRISNTEGAVDIHIDSGSTYSSITSYGTAYGDLLLRTTTSTDDGVWIKGMSGNVGIGTTAPGEKLVVDGTAGSANILVGPVSGAGYGAYNIRDTSAGMDMSSTLNYVRLFVVDAAGVDTTRGIKFGIKAPSTGVFTDHMIVRSDGNVGIGTTDPTVKLEANSGTTNTVAQFTSTDEYAQIKFKDNGGTSTIGTQSGKIWLDSGVNGGDLWIDSSGNVGIGTSAPGTKLEVYGGSGTASQSTGDIFRLYSSTSAKLLVGFDPASPYGTWFQSNSAYPILLNPVAGNVGIGTSAPIRKLDVNGTGRFTDHLYLEQTADLRFVNSQIIHDNGAGGLGIIVPTYSLNLKAGTNSTAVVDFWTNNLARMTIKQDGKIGIGTSAPTRDLSVITGTTNIGNSGGALFVSSYNSGTGGVLIGSDYNVGYIQGVDGLGTSVKNLLLNMQGGNVGIGTTAPGSKLHIVDSTAVGIRLSNVETDDTAKYGYIVGSQYDSGTETEGAFMIGSASTDASTNKLLIGGGSSIVNAMTEIQFYTGAHQATRGGTLRMVIDSTGDVGIGTTNPGAVAPTGYSSGPLLELRSPTTGTDVGLLLRRSDNVVGFDIWMDGGSPYHAHLDTRWSTSDFVFTAVTNERMRIEGDTGDVGIGTADPGYRLEVVGGAIKATGGLIIETRTSDPGSPVAGQVWLRTDL